jgi:hypothetical protein
MKKFNKLLILTGLLLGLSACAPESPRVRVQNQNQEIVDVALKPPSGSTINIDDVSAGVQTSYIEVPSSNYEVDVNVENISPNITTFFQADEDGNYTIIVANTSPPTFRVNQP